MLITSLQIRMTFLESWEEFEKAAERLYLQDPMKVSWDYLSHDTRELVLK